MTLADALPYLSTALATLVAAGGGVLTYRSAVKANRVEAAKVEADRDKALDDRVDRALADVWARLDATGRELAKTQADLAQLTEQHQRLRVAVIRLGYDPDLIVLSPGAITAPKEAP